ncbi:MAG: hypothetical protein JXQ97_15090 [Natronospirillum sp.]
MSKKKRQPTQHSQVERELRTPKYRLRVVSDKTQYDRKRDKKPSAEDFQKAA